MKRVSKYKVRLADIQLYVFCPDYQQQNQRRGTAGAFEICFVSEEGQLSLSIQLPIAGHLTKTIASKRFRELFSPPVTESTITIETTEKIEKS
ncbi:hypothetical protein AUP68_12835 [Ilyonectria robusta]